MPAPSGDLMRNNFKATGEGACHFSLAFKARTLYPINPVYTLVIFILFHSVALFIGTSIGKTPDV
jgi:hypothetical protein